MRCPPPAVEAFGEAMRAALSSSLRAVTTSVEVEDARLLRDDVAIVSCAKHIHDGRADPATGLPTGGPMTYMLVADEAGAWRIALAQTTPEAPAG